MNEHHSVSAAAVQAGWIYGAVGMAIFSASLPATKIALTAFDPIFLTFARAALAGLVGAALLTVLRQSRPAVADLRPLAAVSFGVVIGFPLLTALALRHVDAAHAMIFTGLLPLATAAFGVIRGGDRPRLGFWLCSLAASALVAGYALSRAPAAGAGAWAGDALMAAAIVVCGLGYAEGAVLSRRLGGWQVSPGRSSSHCR